ncbi:type III secretion system outer membrane ring subunit SctC [Chromobacterium piscinae]|uniref:Type 3 secretion system secretin n=1 Tax=Chromobacterium piscinae TaxID=686831 RepID=A0ABV0H9Q1_9NEIS
MKLQNIIIYFLCAYALFISSVALAEPTPPPPLSNGSDASYVAKQDNLRTFFDALSAQLKKPIVVSKQATRKQISGHFDFSQPQKLLERITQQLGLIWYHDGQSVFVYDAAEVRGAVVPSRNASLDVVIRFLRNAGLYDKRYPLRGNDRSGVFYISGPPVYVELVQTAAKFMNEKTDSIALGNLKIGVIALHNTFVSDRYYQLRDQKHTIPGIATVIDQLLKSEGRAVEMVTMDETNANANKPSPPVMPNLEAPTTRPTLPYQAPNTLVEALSKVRDAPSGAIRVVANPNTNSLLVKGTPEQVEFIQTLVTALDVAKRHIELSLWIIDLQKDDLDHLGVKWEGSAKFSTKLGISLNGGSLSTLEGSSFLVSVLALRNANKANIVSRPIVLTQENVPAFFDNNRTFYAELIGERAVEMQQVTYGTLINVVPRVTGDGQIEMALDIEDGNEVPNSTGNTSAIPKVGRTRISTVARVPKGKSLLIGGYTRDDTSEQEGRVPGLSDLPLIGGMFRYRQQRQAKLARVFLIEPRTIEGPLQPDASDLATSFITPSAEDDEIAHMRKLLDTPRGY